jgi:hypothetical protein
MFMPDILEASEFRLVDDNGNLRARLGTDDDPNVTPGFKTTLQIYSGYGGGEAVISMQHIPEGQSLTVNYGGRRILMYATPVGNARILIYDSSNNVVWGTPE